MNNLITIEEALHLTAPHFIDLRSPIEYEEAHIPGALNIPLLENEERSLIGLIYKENSPEAAVDKGFSLISPKLPQIYNRIKNISKMGKVVLYCWRGGMRSQSISQVLDMLGTTHYRLIGGYKSFRRCVNEYFEQPFRQKIVVLHGLTGVGKTDILQRLKADGYSAVNLEELACNRGSVFGHVGMPKAPTQKQFEGLLFMELQKYKKYPGIAAECESRRIGSILIPATFFEAMRLGKKVLIYDKIENRIERLVKTYTINSNSHEMKREQETIRDAINRLRKRLGNVKTEQLLNMLADFDYRGITQQLLAYYYDPLYSYPDRPSPDYDINLNAGDMDNTVKSLKMVLKSF